MNSDLILFVDDHPGVACAMQLPVGHSGLEALLELVRIPGSIAQVLENSSTATLS